MARLRGSDAASPLLAGLAGSAGLHAQCAGALEGVRYRCLDGGRWERPPEALDQAGRAVELPRLGPATEESVQCFPREVSGVHAPSQQNGAQPRGPGAGSVGLSTT